MEIIFDNVTYKENSDISFEKTYLDKVSFTFLSNKINGVLAKDDTCIPELITAIKRPTSGELQVQDIRIKKGAHIESLSEYRKTTAIINCNSNRRFLTDTVKDEITIVLNNYGYNKDKKKRVIDSLKMVGLDESYMTRNPNELSTIEQNKVLFAEALSYNPETLIFVNYDMGLNYKEKESLKRLIRIMKNKYNKTFVIISRNVEFLMDFVDNYIVIDNGIKVAEGTKKDFYNDEIYKYFEMPKIIDFIKSVQKKKHNIDNYVDIKELIKDIYRDVS